MSALSIGRLGKAAGVKVPTIRFYEQIGLLPRADRTESDRRVYGDDAVRRLSLIRHARQLGFEIADIRALLELSDLPERSCDAVDEIARRHLDDVDDRIARLTGLRDELTRMIDQCGRGVVADCRVLNTLGDHACCVAGQH